MLQLFLRLLKLQLLGPQIKTYTIRESIALSPCVLTRQKLQLQNLEMSGECVISSVLYHHNKNLKWRTLKPLVHHSSWTVLQLCVTVQFYLENKGKYILEAWGHADPKDVKRREERERARACTGERLLALWLFFLCVSPPPGPALCDLG